MKIQDTSRNDLPPRDLARPRVPLTIGPRAHRRPMGEWLIGAMLFVASAAFVLWQDSRLTVLWDLSYILENATRIAQGQLPYRDFPFPYAPLTFVMQALIIKLCGRVVLHHYLYAAAASGCATVLTWRILLRLLGASALPSRLAAFLFAAPLLFLGTGGILPLPFYDADCTLAILFCIWLLLRVEARNWPPRATFVIGLLLGVPLFIKQNTGLAFLIAAALCIGWLLLRGIAGRILLLLLSAGTALGFAALLIHVTCGLHNYYNWTVRFAASRRLPSVATMLGFYRDPALIWMYALFAVGIAVFLAARQSHSKRTARLPRTPQSHPSKRTARLPGAPESRSRSHALACWTGCAMLSLPFLWTVAALALQADDSDRAEALLHLWPVLLAASFAFALWRLPHAASFADLVPFVLWGTIHGAFLSQQLWGSTYALWPLLMILIASTLCTLAPRQEQPGARPNPAAAPLTAFSAVVSLALLIAGGHYAISLERLSYADLSGDVLHHSALPPLRGLAMRGDWLPDFEELVAYADREIPLQDALLMVPGEDLFYFTTGRSPQFPVIMFDNTVNPYSAEQVAALAHARNVRWVIVKRTLQLREEPVAFRAQLMGLVARDYEKVESLNNYDIYRRRQD